MKKLLLASIISLISTNIYAQDIQPPAEKSVSIQLTDKEIKYVFETLASQPFKDVASILGKIQMQYNQQNQPAQPTKEAK